MWWQYLIGFIIGVIATVWLLNKADKKRSIDPDTAARMGWNMTKEDRKEFHWHRSRGKKRDWEPKTPMEWYDAGA